MCLQNSPGGMIDMARYGIMRSVLRDAVTAVENKETAEDELAKEIALWLIAHESAMAAAEVRHFHQDAAGHGGFMGDQSRQQVSRGGPDVVGRWLPHIARGNEVIDQELVGAVVTIRQSLKAGG